MKFTTRIIKQATSALFLLVLTLGFQVANASHFAAVDISVQYSGSGPGDLRYTLTMDVYYSCNATTTPAGAIGNAYAFSAKHGHPAYTFNGTTNIAIPMTWTNSVGGGEDIDQLCDGAKNLSKCVDPQNPYPGFKKTTHTGVVTLPSQQTDWIFYWQSCCRDGGIINITQNATGCNPQGNIFIEAGINNLFRYDMGTPIFSEMPLPYLCVNQPANYLNGPIDPQFDSLATYSAIPLDNPGVFYGYCAGYTQANPIGAQTTYVVSPATGTASFTPTIPGQHVLAFRATKFDKASTTPLAFANRDVQVSVLQCNAQAPGLSDPQNISFGTLGGDVFTTCSGVKFDFDVDATTPLPNRQLYMSANLGNFPGASLDIIGQGTTNVTGTFTWAPHYGNIGDHILIIVTKDSTCDATSPIVLKNSKTVLLKVLPSIDAGPDKGICYEGGKPAEIFVKGADNYKLKWTDISGGAPLTLNSDTAQYVLDTGRSPATYVVFATDAPTICKNRDTVSVFMDTENNVDVFPGNPIILCRPDYLQLEGKIFGRPPITPTRCGAPDTLLGKDTVNIEILGSLGPGFDTLGPLTPTFRTNIGSVKQQFLIRRADLYESGLLYGAIRALSFNVVASDASYEYKDFSISVKCTDESTVSAAKGFQTGLTQKFVAPTVTMPNGLNTFTFNSPYAWDTSKNLLIEICYQGNTGVSAGDPIISFVPTDYFSTLTLAQAGNACAVTTSANIKAPQYSRPEFIFSFIETAHRPFDYIWYPSTFLSDSALQQPLAYVPQSAKYYMKTMGRSGCIVKDSADIYMPVHNYTVWPADTAICFNEGAPMHTTGGGFTFKWYKINDKGEYEILSHTDEASCWNCADPVLKPLKTTTYKIAVYDSVWCIDTLTAKITVKPLPDIKILNRDTFVKYGQSIQLMASGARIYNWSPVGSLSNANTSFPVATPTEPTTYIAGGIGANGCRAFDTLNVSVDYRDNLFVPSGFSPNNDGKNDVLKVTNLTFQRVIEFRVFNRWGQEVFMANDNRGWDGAWKGEPQDMDSYTYNIKVGFPDGHIETYRGTTTLIR